jgi:hypothetical protein
MAGGMRSSVNAVCVPRGGRRSRSTSARGTVAPRSQSLARVVQAVRGRAVGVSVDHVVCTMRLQQGQGCTRIHVGVDLGAALARLALGTQIVRDGVAFCQGLGQEVTLPVWAAHLGAKPLVVGVVQAQGITMGQYPAFAGKDQYRGIVQQGHVSRSGERRAHQEVAVAVQDVQVQPLGGRS